MCPDLAERRFTIDTVLSQAECRDTVERAERVGFEIATINAWERPRVDTKVRDNDRVILDDVALASELGAQFGNAFRHSAGAGKCAVSTRGRIGQYAG